MQTSNPWAGPSERLNYNLRYETDKTKLDVANLSRRQARDEALETALEEGRIYGMRQMRCELKQQRALNKLLQSHLLAAAGW